MTNSNLTHKKKTQRKSSAPKNPKPQTCREFFMSIFYNQETHPAHCYDSTDYSQVFHDLHSFNVKLVSVGGLKMMKRNSWLNNQK